MVVKRDGSKQAFDRDKLLRGLQLACRKRPVRHEQLDAIVRQVEQWSDRRFVHGALVNLRAGPSLDYRVIDRLPKRTPVFPERSHRDWKLVRTPSGQVGWVHDALLRTP